MFKYNKNRRKPSFTQLLHKYNPVKTENLYASVIADRQKVIVDNLFDFAVSF